MKGNLEVQIPSSPGEANSAIFSVTKVKRYKKRCCWAREHYDYLNSLVLMSNPCDWNHITAKMIERFPSVYDSPKKCKERWEKYWKAESPIRQRGDDSTLQLIICHYTLKNKWSIISQMFPGRSRLSLKQDLYDLVKRVIADICPKGCPSNTPAVTPLYFIEVLYVTIIITDLLKPADGNPRYKIVPAYIYDYIKTSGISVEKCIEYLGKVKASLLLYNPNASTLQSLSSYETLADYKELFHGVAISLKLAKPISSMSASSLIIFTLEEVLSWSRDSKKALTFSQFLQKSGLPKKISKEHYSKMRMSPIPCGILNSHFKEMRIAGSQVADIPSAFEKYEPIKPIARYPQWKGFPRTIIGMGEERKLEEGSEKMVEGN